MATKMATKNSQITRPFRRTLIQNIMLRLILNMYLSQTLTIKNVQKRTTKNSQKLAKTRKNSQIRMDIEIIPVQCTSTVTASLYGARCVK
jgi:hypothetical protein